MVGSLIAAAVVVTPKEVVDFLHLVLGASRTPINWKEIINELSLITISGALVLWLARLFEERQGHPGELNLLFEVGKRVTSVLDLEEVLQVIIESAIEAIPAAEKGTLHLLDEETGELVVRASSGFSRELVEAARFRVGEGYTGWVFEHGEPAIIDNVHAEPRTKPIELPEVAEEKSAICAALMARGKTIGTLTLDNATTHGAFNERDVELLYTFANQAAIAIENAHLFEAERKQRRKAETLHRTALALTTSLDRNQVIERILAQLQEVVPYDSALVQILQGDRLVIIGGQGFPNVQELLGISFPVYGDNPYREVMRTLEPCILEDAPATHAAFTQEPLAQIAIRCWLGVSMLIGKRPVGMITLGKCQPGFYTEEDASVAQAFAAQAAIAIENASLFEEQERRVAHLRAISEVGRDIASVLNPDKLLHCVVNLLVDVLGYNYANILMVDKEAQEIVLTASAGEIEGLADTKSELAVPIKLKGHVIGVLDVQSKRLNAFDEVDRSTVTTLADQLAVAVENARLYRETERLAITDGLTGLYNHRHFYELLQREVELANRYGEHLSLIMLDIDGFKAYNDTYGHLAGDALLRELSQLLAREIRRVDIAARYGGDEFIILLPHTDKEPAVALAGWIRTSVERYQFLGEDGLPRAKVSVSLGVATCPEDAVEPEVLVKAADMALLEAKKSGKRVCVYREMDR